MPLGLNLDLTGVDTKFPSINPGEYLASVTKVEGDESEKTPGQYNLAVEMQLEVPAKSTEGADLSPGFKLKYNITLPGGEEDKYRDIRQRSTAQFIDAALGSVKENRPVLNDDLLPTFIGKQVKIIVVMRQANKDGSPNLYGDTQIQGVKPAVETSAV